jgi:asparagine synthase (glutamine-hydrolysing)
MSIIFGIRKCEGEITSEREMQDLACATSRYAVDGVFVQAKGEIGMGFQPYRTHDRCHLELQPLSDSHGNLLCLDGRLDNHKDLCEMLDINGTRLSDSAVVLSAFEQWGENCFSRLVGDWALAIWSGKDRSLYLARDHAGVRTLYFEQTNDSLRWSTYLDTFFADGRAHALSIDFAGHYLAAQPIGTLTPFRDIRAVPPAHYLRFSGDKVVRRSHWEPVGKEVLRYKSDSEYDAHFLSLFRQSVERRIGRGAPILAHLSGGMDSTAIVCMSDRILRQQPEPNHPGFTTLSYYDDSEPNWNEKPYFSIVERKRGIVGIHIQASFMDRTFRPASAQHLYLIPGSDSGSIVQEETLTRAFGSCEYRVVLSGIGGDELLGGAPTPYPELADLVTSGRVFGFLGQAFAWSMARRCPLTRTLAGTGKFLHKAYFPSTSVGNGAQWLRFRHSARYRSEIPQPSILKMTRPSSLHSAMVWWNMLETLPNLRPEFLIRREYRFPYLDRDLVDFLLRIPRGQLVRPGRRRSMMRRALKEIVPEEILERRRKAFLDRGQILALRSARGEIRSLFTNSVTSSVGLIDPGELLRRLNSISLGLSPQSSFLLMRAVGYELWLRANAHRIAQVRDGAGWLVPDSQSQLRIA